MDVGVNHRLTLSSFYGDDVLYFDFEDESSYEDSHLNEYQEDKTVGSLDWRWGNRTNSLTWRWIVSPKLIVKTFLAESRYIVRILYENGGKSTKSLVEQEIFTLFQHEFEKPYYKETVSHGVPRWKHNIAWAKERAKQLHGFIKSAKESDRGIWELTDKGISYCENNL